MEKFWILILVSFFATNSLEKAESVQLEELPLQKFDELFVEGWWDKDEAEFVQLEELPLQKFDELFVEGWWDKGEAEDLKTPAPTNFGQNVHHQIDRQNTQIGQIEPNSTDQNPPLSESDHSDNTQNSDGQNEIINEITSTENITEDERKRNIIAEFHAMRNELKQKGKFPRKERNQIEDKIAKLLKVNRKKIYKWKKEFGLGQKVSYEKEKRKPLIEEFDQRKAELMRKGLKNSYKQEIDKTVAKELGISVTTIYSWKNELGQTKPTHKHPHSEQKELMKRYYQIKGQNHKISDKEIAKKMLKIGTNTLSRWKKQVKRQQLHQNSVDGHSVEENGAANVQEIGNECQ